MVSSPINHQEELSDYGSDFTPDQEEILNGFLQQEPVPSDSDILIKDIKDEETPRGARICKSGHEEHPPLPSPTGQKKRVTIQIDGHSDSDILSKTKSTLSRNERERSVSIEAPLDPKPDALDLRSPLERFRTKPKKALSVTDLVSPSWCQLQYWFVLTKHGKKRRTPAMRQGSAVHKVLEEQVHQIVPVDVATKEDAWGLRVWNVIQGLKGLRETGLTRELEVWGTIDGLVVNGVIDEISHVCPDRELEISEEMSKTTGKVDSDQATITDFLGGSTLENGGKGIFAGVKARKDAKKVYITDVKTRGASKIPAGASLRPTKMQLMLYHRLLSDMATNKVDAEIIFDRYELKPDEPFSDGFIAQIGGLNEYSQDVPSSAESEEVSSTQDSMTVLLEHNSLRSLWGLMVSELSKMLPGGAKSIGNVLKAEYRNANDGEIMGQRTFLYDDKFLQGYLDDEMRWWKGEQEAQGVCLEEAYKCGFCEFADDCGWRKNKILEATEKMRRTRSVV